MCPQLIAMDVESLCVMVYEGIKRIVVAGGSALS